MTNCGRCVNWNSGVCALFKTQTSESQSCPAGLSSTAQCNICGSVISPRAAIIVEEALICEKCYSLKNTCASCSLNQDCAFENDPSPLPKVVIQSFRQDNTIIQKQVLNPERVNLLCKNCSCFHDDGVCARPLNLCAKYLRNY